MVYINIILLATGFAMGAQGSSFEVVHLDEAKISTREILHSRILSSRETSTQSYYPGQLQCNLGGSTCEAAVSLAPVPSSLLRLPAQKELLFFDMNTITNSLTVRKRISPVREYR